MTPFITDLIILALLFVSALIAFFRGFIKEVLTIVSLFGAIGGTYLWGASLIEFFQNWGKGIADSENNVIWGLIPLDIFAPIASYGSVFIILFAVLSILSHFIGKSAQNVGLGSVDRTLGFAFGLARGILILGLINIAVLALLPKEEQPIWLKDARTMIIIDRTSETLMALKPEEAEIKTKDIEKTITDEINHVKEKASDLGYDEKDRDQLEKLLEQVE